MKRKRGFMEDRYETYDPAVEGYGNERQWRAAFRSRMGSPLMTVKAEKATASSTSLDIPMAGQLQLPEPGGSIERGVTGFRLSLVSTSQGTSGSGFTSRGLSGQADAT